ncbi:MAG: 1-acyl-sn-glycerol-3-phosphate acyltransferase, partial [Actinomycetes bacterium]
PVAFAKLDVPGMHVKSFTSEIIGSAGFQTTLDELAVETGRTRADVEREARADLHEIAAEPNSMAIDFWDKAARWLARAYKLDVNHKQIERLRELNAGSTLVFLPNHRSYLDPLVLRSALMQHGFPPNNTFGGANLAFWPMGPIGRRNGAVFIRREFKNDAVYKATLKEFILYLVNNHHNLEWYIEGGRTRTGKLRPPRMGILSYLVDAFDATPPDDDTDVLLVPVFVAYDQQYEVGAISNEEQGGSKDPESVSWLYNFAKAQQTRRGRAHLRFGEPLSLRSSLKENKASGDPRLAVPKIAFEVMHRINKATPVMPTSLITFALLDNDDRALTINEGRQILNPLISYIKARGLDLSEDIDLSDHGQLRDAVSTLVSNGIVERYAGGLEPVFRVPEKRQHEAAFYRNPLLHYFITRSIVEIALVKAVEDDQDDPIEAVWEEALRLRDILKYEFFFPRKSHFAAEIEREANLAYPGWREENFTSAHLLQALSMTDLYLAPRVLGQFLDAYGILADRLAAHDPLVPVDRSALIMECIGVGQQRFLQKELHSPESISRDLFSGAFQLAGNRDLIDSGTPELQARRDAFAAELADAIRRVDVIREMAKPEEDWDQ